MKRSIGDTEVEVLPPYLCEISANDLAVGADTPMTSLTAGLRPAPKTTTAVVTFGDDPAQLANALQVTFRRTEFDRSDPDQLDPSHAEVFGIVNQVMGRMRVLVQAPGIRELGPATTIWERHYLDDDGAELSRVEGTFRRIGAGQRRTETIPVTTWVWEELADDLSESPVPIWERFLLDAFSLLPDIPPALSLGHTAIELRIESAIAQLAGNGAVSAALWTWINDRGDFRKDPSVKERLDGLLRGVCGRSLKDEANLWQAYEALRKARNRCTHEGATDIAESDARTLLQGARAIIDWIELLLPPESRRQQPPDDLPLMTFKSTVYRTDE